MKKLIVFIAAVFAITAVDADDILIWKPDFKKPLLGSGIWTNQKSGVEGKAEFTGNTMKLTVVKNPLEKKNPSFAQGLLLYTGKWERGVKYEISYDIKSNWTGKVWAAVTMAQAPWKPFKGEYVNLTANETEDVDIEFVVPQDYNGKYIRLIYLGLGKAPEGTVFEISNVKLEKDVD